jgi:hypothetical protein
VRNSGPDRKSIKNSRGLRVGRVWGRLNSLVGLTTELCGSCLTAAHLVCLTELLRLLP